jgi:PBP1b-binding outer membrane lipoprotein LpoB
LAGTERIAHRPYMKLAYRFNAVSATNLPRRLSIACAAAFLVLGGCSNYDTPRAAVNYREAPEAKTENHARSLEQVIKDQRDWYQMIE